MGILNFWRPAAVARIAPQRQRAIRFNLFAHASLAYRQKGFPLLSLADAST
jgi:hypothetical protein